MKSLLPIAGILSVLLASCGRVRVNAPPGNYDLEATSVKIDPEIVFVHDGVVLSTVVTNKGADSIPGGSYEVDLYLEQNLVSFDHATSEILPGLTVEYGMTPGMFHWKPNAPGVYTYRFIVDEKDRLTEQDESNNVISGTITVMKKLKSDSDDAQ